VTAEIICVGTELLLGDILNTNAQFLSRELAELGISVMHQHVIGDNPARLKELVLQAKSRSDLLVFSGGLGPTEDDLTKETVAEAFGDTLAFDEGEWQKIIDFFARTNRRPTPNNRKQAMCPTVGHKLINDHGTAPGAWFEDADGHCAALMPGARIVATACPLFVPLVENGYFGADNAVTRLVARDYLKDIRAAGVDTLILGCTHYPLIAPIIADLMGPEVALIDPGRETALAARDALASAGLLREGRAGTARYYVSDTTESFAQLSDWFLGEYAGGPVTRISVDGYPVEQGAST